MKKITLASFSLVVLALSACQTTPRQYNGVTGYQIENQTTDSATLAYTLSGRANSDLDVNKLQRACKKVLGETKTYKLNVLSVNEIINPQVAESKTGVQLGHSRTSFGLSNTQTANSSENYATRQALDTRPSTLHVVRYTCS
ncbi:MULTISPECIES: hypothetical protein [Acinetobacter]|uniref:Uncharacterized protein n=1 Tax=Acinetobacter wuhouensis TaxID=1879050 RepID=A0A3G2T0B5_9GAMM|nr:MULTISPECIES: hypothetical protein [Acinetobacter]AYO53558.1 hypothetical protein CDG68_07855 [Acinetobacter wuhouensis]RZG77289.1 hypothetical protein EXE09_05195 [Acinetobacter sp. WCHAc060025]RZG86202.1 hypothetical protein EXE10_07730 [Acinetobacter sp. WCHAc060033]